MSPVRVRSDVCGAVRVMAHLLGYARVSTTEQNPDLQVDELTGAGCWKVWTDHAPVVLDRRPQLEAVLEQLRPGDTLVVWRLDRLGRSLRHLIEVVTGLDERGVGFRSLRASIDTTTAGGRLVFHLFGALAQFEREIIRDRTVAGLTAARARGRVGGRPYKLSVEQRRQARKMYDARELTVEQIGAVLGVSRTSIYRALGKGTRPAPSAAATRPRGLASPGRCGAANLVRCPLLASACRGRAALTGVWSWACCQAGRGCSWASSSAPLQVELTSSRRRVLSGACGSIAKSESWNAVR